MTAVNYENNIHQNISSIFTFIGMETKKNDASNLFTVDEALKMYDTIEEGILLKLFVKMNLDADSLGIKELGRLNMIETITNVSKIDILVHKLKKKTSKY